MSDEDDWYDPWLIASEAAEVMAMAGFTATPCIIRKRWFRRDDHTCMADRVVDAVMARLAESPDDAAIVRRWLDDVWPPDCSPRRKPPQPPEPRTWSDF